MKAVILGSGNVAWHIAPALSRAGVDWVQVYSRTRSNAEQLSSHLGGVPFTDRIEAIDTSADLYLLAVSDQAVTALGKILRLPGKTVIHVAGSVPLSALEAISEHYGVMYFFQTFSKQAPTPNLQQTPVCIEASDTATANLLQDLAARLSQKVCSLSSEQRQTLHIGGVLVNNYVNLMYTAAHNLFNEKNMDFSLLYPLMEQTLQKAMRMPPAQAMTGPALRGDDKVLQDHLRYLSQSRQGQKYLEAYRLLWQAIQNEKKQ